MKTIKTILFISALTAVLAGCEKPVHFPAESLPEAARKYGALAAYDTRGKGRADYYLFARADGRVNCIAYADGNSDSPVDKVDLDTISFKDCRHLLIILDGFGYEAIKEYYDAGGLRVCYPPSRVIAPYPTLTDLCIEDLLGYVTCRGMEALYYNRKTNRVEGGTSDYLDGKNEPYNQLLQYRADSLWDAIGYLYPVAVFGKELNDIKRTLDANKTREVLTYSVSSAGISTRLGKAGQLKALVDVERLVNQVVMETRGKVKITLTADHGHCYTPCTQIPLDEFLKGKGWNLVDSLSKPKDVAYIRFGVETDAVFSTNQATELANDLASHDGVTVASYADKDSVVVLGGRGEANQPAGRTILKAVIRQKNGRYKYEPVHGDPLDLAPILAKLKADGEGYYNEDELLPATYLHQWPDPLQRLWRAHFGIVENTPDVIASLADWYFSGSSSFGGAITVASTHGGLNRRNSTTFIMSTAGPLPPYMRSADIPRNMEKLTGEKFPMRK